MASVDAGTEVIDADTAPGDTTAAAKDAAEVFAKDTAQACSLPTQWGIAGNGEVQKVAMLAVSPKNEGCDLDGDGKPNNFLSKVLDLYPDLGKALAARVSDGTLSILLEPLSYATDGTPFQVQVLQGLPDPVDGRCAVTAEGANCAYEVGKSSYDLASKAAACPARNAVPGLTITAGALVAGEPPYLITLDIPGPGMAMTLPVHVLAITGTIGPGASPQSIHGGRLCGAVRNHDVCLAIYSATPEKCLGWPVKGDIDTDGDDQPDAMSVSLDFATVGGHVTGLAGK